MIMRSFHLNERLVMDTYIFPRIVQRMFHIPTQHNLMSNGSNPRRKGRLQSKDLNQTKKNIIPLKDLPPVQNPHHLVSPRTPIHWTQRINMNHFQTQKRKKNT
jgi:hypothetical protein